MSKIKELIEFLRLDRRYDEDKEKNKEIDQTKVSITGIYSNLMRTVERKEFEEFNLYERIFNILDQHEATHFYVLPLYNKNVFYIKLPPTADGYNYLNIETKKSEPVEDETQLLPIEINDSPYHYFYDKEQREVVISSENLKDTAVFYDSIFFDPEKMNLQTATYEYQYSKPLSSYYKFIDSVLTLLKRIVSFLIFKDTSLKNVEVEVKKKGSIFLIPSIFIVDRKNYYVYYYYTSSSKKMFYQINDEDIAIKLKFKGKEPFLSYLNETIFTQQSFDFSDAYNKQRRIDFIASFKEEIIFPLERQMLNGSISDFRDAMITLFYLTDDVAFTISNECLWRLFEQIVDRDNLVNSSALPEENLFIKLLDIIAKKETNEKLFLNRLLQIKDDKITYLELLFNGLNGENNTHFVNLVYSIWKKTDYIQIDPSINALITDKSPVLVDYRSDKTLGFHHDNAKIEWNQKTKAIDVKVTVGTGEYKENIHFTKHGYYKTNDEVKETLKYNYHPFSPLALLNSDNPKFLIKDEEEEGEPIQLLPAFVLYAHSEGAFWKNWLTAGEYAVDVLTTISGVGNILKFGRLYKVLQAGNSLAGKTRTFTKVVTTVKGVAGVAEISSGSVNILLKLTGVADTDLGREISKYLFYFEMFALSGEVSIALYRKVQKSAAKILAKEKVLRESLSNENDIKQLELALKEIKIIVNNTEKIVYVPFRFNKVYSFSAAALDTALNVGKNIFFYLKNLRKAETETVFYKGVEIFTASPAKVKALLEDAAKVLKTQGVKGVEEFFEATGSVLAKKRLHSQTGETFICNLVRKKEMNKYYYYEIEDFQYGIQNWNRKLDSRSERFECFVTLANKPNVPETIGKNILYADLYVPKSLNDTFQANKLDLTDISLGKTMLDDGYAVLKKDLGKDLDGIYGEWLNNPGYKDFGGESVNLTKLKEAMGNLDITKENLEKAAMETVTGKWAKSKGFTKAKIVSDENVYKYLNGNINQLKQLEVIFIK